MSLAKRSGSVLRLAPREQRQAIFVRQMCFALLWTCVIYKALVLSQRLACWCSLSCGSKRIPWVVARNRG